jgi:hypothetical protein
MHLKINDVEQPDARKPLAFCEATVGAREATRRTRRLVDARAGGS